MCLNSHVSTGFLRQGMGCLSPGPWSVSLLHPREQQHSVRCEDCLQSMKRLYCVLSKRMRQQVASNVVRGEVEDFIKAGLVTYSYHAWSGFEGSTPIAARLCLDDHGQDHAWMGFIDVDEYVVLRQGHSSLPEFLKAYVNYAALKVYRRPIHYSGHEKRPQAFTLSAFTQCLPQEQGNWLKSFVQPKYTSNAGMSSHHFQHTQGRKPVSSDFELESDWSGSKHLEDKIVLFHYEYRSVEEYSAKIARHSVGGNFRANMDWFLHTAAQATENCTDLEHWWELHPFNCLVYDAQAVSRQTN